GLESAHECRRYAPSPPFVRSPQLAHVAWPGGDGLRRTPAMAVAAGDRQGRGLACLAPGGRAPARGRGEPGAVLPAADPAVAPRPGPRELRRPRRGPVRIRPRLVGSAGRDRARGRDRGPGAP